MKVLEFVKARRKIPLAEEKQLLDCLKLVLDNEWTVGTEEMLKLFDMLQLRQKAEVAEEFTEFLEFITLLAMQLKCDTDQIENYFH